MESNSVRLDSGALFTKKCACCATVIAYCIWTHHGSDEILSSVSSLSSKKKPTRISPGTLGGEEKKNIVHRDQNFQVALFQSKFDTARASLTTGHLSRAHTRRKGLYVHWSQRREKPQGVCWRDCVSVLQLNPVCTKGKILSSPLLYNECGMQTHPNDKRSVLIWLSSKSSGIGGIRLLQMNSQARQYETQ